MKKMLLVAALGVAGLVSANQVSYERGFDEPVTQVAESSEELLVDEWCGTVSYPTSCGFIGYDSWCSSWGIHCLMEASDMFEEYYCGE